MEFVKIEEAVSSTFTEQVNFIFLYNLEWNRMVISRDVSPT